MTKKLVLLPFMTLLLAGCNQTQIEEENVRWVSPLGAPSLAFYDQGNNKADWVSQKAALMPAELQGQAYDAVIFDSITGLASIKSNGGDFALAKVITAGNFYLVGINKTEMPSAGDKIIAFQKDKVPDKVFKKLASDKWGLDTSSVKYVTGDVSNTAPVLQTGKYENESVDYVLTAEPVFTANKATALNNGITLSEIKCLRSEWKDLTGMDYIVQAGVFVRKSSIESKKEKLKTWMSSLEERLDKVVKNDMVVKQSLTEYGDKDAQQARFGIAAPIVDKVQGENANRLGFVDSSIKDTINVNTFLTSLGESTYEDSYFVNIK